MSCLLLYLSSNGILTVLFISNLDKYQPISSDEINSHDTLILLGTGLERSSFTVTPTLLGYSRILEAYRIYHIAKSYGINYKIIISGGDVRKFGTSEAAVYGDILKDMGVSKADLVLENKSLNTYQNAKYTKKLIKNQLCKEYVLVTSALHMKRSMLYFQYFGIEAIPAISDNPRPITSILPFSYNITLLDLAIHEYLSILRFHVYRALGLNKKNAEFANPGQ